MKWKNKRLRFSAGAWRRMKMVAGGKRIKRLSVA